MSIITRRMMGERTNPAILYLYRNGSTCNSVTGGYLRSTIKTYENTPPDGQVTYGNDAMTITYNLFMMTANMIDLTPYSRFYVKGKNTSNEANNSSVVVGSSLTNKGSYYVVESQLAGRSIPTGSQPSTISIDISSISGLCTLGYGCLNYNNPSSTIIYEAWLEQ